MAPGLFASVAAVAAIPVASDDVGDFDERDQRGFKVYPALLSLGGPRRRQQM